MVYITFFSYHCIHKCCLSLHELHKCCLSFHDQQNWCLSIHDLHNCCLSHHDLHNFCFSHHDWYSCSFILHYLHICYLFIQNSCNIWWVSFKLIHPNNDDKSFHAFQCYILSAESSPDHVFFQTVMQLVHIFFITNHFCKLGASLFIWITIYVVVFLDQYISGQMIICK